MIDKLERILASARAIPPGRVTSYGRLAVHAGFPRGARLAVAALRGADDETVPWHRILRADGRIAFPPDHPHHAEQAQRLRAEGVMVRNGRVDLGRFGWRVDAPDLLLPPD